MRGGRYRRALALCLVATIGLIPAAAGATAYHCVMTHQVFQSSMTIERVGPDVTAAVTGLSRLTTYRPDMAFEWGNLGGDRGTITLTVYAKRPGSSAPGSAYVFRLAGAGETRDVTAPMTRYASAKVDWSSLDAQFAKQDRIDMTLLLRGGGKADKVVARALVSLDALRIQLAARPQLERVLAEKAADPAANCSDPGAGKGQIKHSFDCTRSWTTELGSFDVDSDRLIWSREMDGVSVELTYLWTYDEEGPRRNAIEMRNTWMQPKLMVEFKAAALGGRRWGSQNFGNADGKGWHYADEGSIAIGDDRIAAWLSGNSIFVATWPGLQRLFVQPGDIRISARNIETGETTIRTMPAGAIERALAELLAGYDTMVADLASPVGRCRPVSETIDDPAGREDIVIT